jgi:hypothetical protein
VAAELITDILVKLLRLCAVVVIWFGLCNVIRGRGDVSEQDFFLSSPRSGYGLQHCGKH